MKKNFEEWGRLVPSIILVTAPAPDAADYMPDFEPPSNYTDPTKIRKWVLDKADKFLAKAAIDSMAGEVVGISTYTQDGDATFLNHLLSDSRLATGESGFSERRNEAGTLVRTSYVPDEHAVLHVFAQAAKSVPGLIGNNLHGFTLPFLARRMLKYRIEFDERFLPRPRYFEQSLAFDTMKAWGMGKKDDEFVSMKNLTRFLGFDGPRDTPGGTMPRAFVDPETFLARFAEDRDEALDDLGRAAEYIYLAASNLYSLFGDRVDSSRDFLTINEARARDGEGLAPIEGGDVLPEPKKIATDEGVE